MNEASPDEHPPSSRGTLIKIGLSALVLVIAWLAFRFVTRWIKWLAIGIAVGVLYYFVVSRPRETDK